MTIMTNKPIIKYNNYNPQNFYGFLERPQRYVTFELKQDLIYNNFTIIY